MRTTLIVLTTSFLLACGGGGGDSTDTGGTTDADTADGAGDVMGDAADDTGDADPSDTDPGDTDPSDTDPSDTDPGDTDPGDTGPGDATDTDDDTLADTTPGDTGGGDTDDDVDDVVGDVTFNPCDLAIGDPCTSIGDTRCNLEDASVVQSCTVAEGCLQWVDSAVCDFDLCTNSDSACVDGACVADGDPVVICDTLDDPCMENVCNPSTGQCEVKMLETGMPCDDMSACTVSDACFAGDCVGTFDCPKQCLSTEITCGETVDMTLISGGTKVMDSYSCMGTEDGLSGFERAFLITNTNAFDCPDFVLSVELDDPANAGVEYADLIVLGTGSGVCNPDECVGGALMGDDGRAQLIMPLTMSQQYVVVVDGRNGYEGNVRLAVSCCGKAVEAYCSNGVDDDGDSFGTNDCLDADCVSSDVCGFEHACADGFDDDGDGSTDCQDPECVDSPDCDIETNCSDGLDDEPDGKTDCEDEDCAGVGACTSSCPGAIDIACGETLSAQVMDGGNTQFSGQAWPDCGNGIITYNNPHQIYQFQSATGCAAVTVDAGGGTFLDVYLAGGECTTSQCIDAGSELFSDPTVNGSGLGSGWAAVFLDDSFYESGKTSAFSVALDCTCP